jgi:hypothetical protein
MARMGAGRNDPCPCGSGKKFKHCCLHRAQAATGITPADRTEALDALNRYASRDELAGFVAQAALVWAAEDCDDDADLALESIFDFETSTESFFDWLYFDVPLEDRRTLSAHFLDRHARSLNPRAADYIRLMQGTHLRPYQVRRVRPGAGLELRDLWTREDLFVTERSATRQLVVWDVLVGRVVEHADGTRQLEGSAMLLPPGAEADMMRVLRRGHRSFAREFPHEGLDDFFKRSGPLFHLSWFTEVAEPEPMTLTTTEGDPVVFSTLVFELPPGGAPLARLLEEPDFEPEPGGAAWFEPDVEPSRLLGSVACDDEALTLKTMSRERAARGRARLEAVLGPLTLRTEEYREPDPHIEPEDEDEAYEETAEFETASELQAYLEQKDCEWLDLQVPALDDRTPREAARSWRLRPRLARLLMAIENREARAALHGHGRDVGWMWEALGLKRP